MIKKRTLVILTIIPFIIGNFLAHQQAGKLEKKNDVTFSPSYIQPNDTIALSSQGNIFVISQTGIKQITRSEQVIEPAALKNTFIAVKKEKNYSSLEEFSQNGNRINILLNGSTNTIDTMSWVTDPSINKEQDKIAYVSDKDRQQTNVPDNELYVLNLSTGKSTHIAKPYPYSGGIAHPVWNPIDSNILLFDYYQYDHKTLLPYSTIMEYNKISGEIFPLTTNKQNAFQAAFSPDGKKLLFLIRNDNMLTVSLHIADFTKDGISNEHKVATGDYAYPIFSNSSNYIYYLHAEGNNGYDLMVAKIVNYTLTDIHQVTKGSGLLGNSSYSVRSMDQ